MGPVKIKKVIQKILKNGLPVKQYRNLTGDIFKQIFMVKDILAGIDQDPMPEDWKIKFKFKK